MSNWCNSSAFEIIQKCLHGLKLGTCYHIKVSTWFESLTLTCVCVWLEYYCSYVFFLFVVTPAYCCVVQSRGKRKPQNDVDIEWIAIINGSRIYNNRPVYKKKRYLQSCRHKGFPIFKVDQVDTSSQCLRCIKFWNLYSSLNSC